MTARPWLTPARRLLLRAALAPGATGSTAWTELRPSLDIDRLDPCSSRLLPLLAWNLSRLAIDDPLRPRLLGVHRHSWTRAQLRRRALARALESLHAGQIDTLLLNDEALGRHYPSVGLRPIGGPTGGVDVLVPEAQTDRAMERLVRSGFAPAGLVPPPAALPRRYSRAFRSPEGEAIALHGRIPWECWSPGLDADLWRHSVGFSLGPVPTRALCPSDELLQVCLQGAPWREVPTVDWLADVVFLLGESGAGVDWPRVVDLARRSGVTLPLYDGLALARAELGAPVPPAVLAELDGMSVPRWQRLEHALRVRAPTSLAPLWRHALRHWRHEGDAGLLRAAWRFPRYLARTFELEGIGQVPRFLLRALLRRARRPAPGAAGGAISAPVSEKSP